MCVVCSRVFTRVALGTILQCSLVVRMFVRVCELLLQNSTHVVRVYSCVLCVVFVCVYSCGIGNSLVVLPSCTYVFACM